MDPDTDIGGGRNKFPVTSHSAIVAVRSKEPEVRQRAFESILISYWKPAYKYIRLKWNASNEDAKDLTQGFFTTAIEKNYFAKYDSARASFHTYLRTCLDGFVANHRKSEQRLKRGGSANHFSLDYAEAERELARQQVGSDVNPEDYFHKEWVRALFVSAIESLRERYEVTGKQVHFTIFETYDLRDDDAPRITYTELARKFALSSTDVNNYLAAARRDFRRTVLDKLRDITGSEEEFQREARDLLGIRVT